MLRWLHFEEYVAVGSLSKSQLALREDQVLGFGMRDDGLTWIRTPTDCHIVTCPVNRLTELINQPTYE